MESQSANNLERYWKGDLTSKEEDAFYEDLQLGRLLVGNETDQVYFSMLSKFRSSKLGDDFNREILESIKQPSSRRWLVRPWLTMAASICLLVLAGNYLLSPTQGEEVSEEQIQLAYTTTMQTLYLMSSELNRGAAMSQLDEFDKTLEKIKGKN